MAQQMLNLGGNLPPEELLKQQQIARQQQMAQMLMQQGQQVPQGQMVSGRYVAPSFTQSLAGLANVYLGKKELEKAEEEQLKMAERLREREGQSVKEYFQALEGTPAQPVPKGYELVDAGTPATGPNYQKALQIATNPYAPSWLKSQAVEMLKPQKLGEGDVLTRINPRTGQMETIASGGEKYRAPISVDTGTAIELRDPANPTVVLQRIPKSLSPADAARMQFEGITGGGMPMVNAPAQSSKFAPAIQPQYQYNPSISPKLNQEAAAKFAETLTKNETNAKDSFDLMKAASKLLSSEAPSSGRLSNIVTGTGEIFNISGAASKADSRLNLLSGALTMKQPRFEGPQGVLDVTLYQKLAGDLGNPNIPIASRLGNIEEMINLQKKYYPQGDWDSISTKTQGETKTEAVKSAGKVSLGAPQYATNPKTGERIVSTDGGINWKPAGNK